MFVNPVHAMQVIGHVQFLWYTDEKVSKLLVRALVSQYDWGLVQHHWGTPYVYQPNYQQFAPAITNTPLIEDEVSE